MSLQNLHRYSSSNNVARWVNSTALNKSPKLSPVKSPVRFFYQPKCAIRNPKLVHKPQGVVFHLKESDRIMKISNKRHHKRNLKLSFVIQYLKRRVTAIMDNIKKQNTRLWPDFFLSVLILKLKLPVFCFIEFVVSSERQTGSSLMENGGYLDRTRRRNPR